MLCFHLAMIRELSAKVTHVTFLSQGSLVMALLCKYHVILYIMQLVQRRKESEEKSLKNNADVFGVEGMHLYDDSIIQDRVNMGIEKFLKWCTVTEDWTIM